MTLDHIKWTPGMQLTKYHTNAQPQNNASLSHPKQVQTPNQPLQSPSSSNPQTPTEVPTGTGCEGSLGLTLTILVGFPSSSSLHLCPPLLHLTSSHLPDLDPNASTLKRIITMFEWMEGW